MLYIIADTHFNHKRLVEMGHRPEDFTQVILSNWCAIVKPEDTVIHLGDVILGRVSMLPSIMNSLPGTKILVRGNHDYEPPRWYEKRGFALVVDEFVRSGVIFSHVPKTPLPEGVVCCYHGHFHSEDNSHREQDLPPEIIGYDYAYYLAHKQRYRLVSIEKCLGPVLLTEPLF